MVGCENFPVWTGSSSCQMAEYSFKSKFGFLGSLVVVDIDSVGLLYLNFMIETAYTQVFKSKNGLCFSLLTSCSLNEPKWRSQTAEDGGLIDSDHCLQIKMYFDTDSPISELQRDPGLIL